MSVEQESIIASLTPRSPQTAEEFKKYYFLRWEVLRKPLGRVLGYEADTLNEEGVHAFIITPAGEVIATGRIYLENKNIARARSMAVHPSWQRKGLGAKILDFLENSALQLKCRQIVLNARFNAKSFYEANGYTCTGISTLEWGYYKHFEMIKNLPGHDF